MTTLCRTLLMVTGMFLVSCTTEAPEVAPSCVASLETCSIGLFHGACPGTAGSLFACRNDGECRWFSGGCPTGYHASPCASNDVCCHHTSDGPWPFEDGWTPDSPMGTELLHNNIALVRSRVIDDTSPAEVSVSIDETVGPASNVPVCTAGAALELCNRGMYETPLARRLSPTSVVVRFASNYLRGEELLLEVVQDEEGVALFARVFLRHFTDAAGDLSRACRPAQGPVAMSGHLRLSNSDLDSTETHGVLELVLVDGAMVTLTF